MNDISASIFLNDAGAASHRRNVDLRRYQLLRYRDVTRLCDVMETVVPIHGTGNFPTLDIEPFMLVQLVRNRLQSIGIKVRDIRLNGSAATHVLAGDMVHTYKDLDLIFAIDFPSSLAYRQENEKKESDVVSKDRIKTAVSSTDKDLPLPPRPNCLPVDTRSEAGAIAEKDPLDDNVSVDDSGYTSSGSSGPSFPPSPCSHNPSFRIKQKRKAFRCRTRSQESLSSTSSIASYKAPLEDFNLSHFNRHNWQAIKDATMDVLLDFLPPRVNRTNMNSIVLGNAYVQKMVKVSNASDKWSLISLNNNSGRNLELKFVQSMKRQYEFSVDSFQIALDSYLAYKQAVSENNGSIKMSENFFPTVIAESVYGDFAGALRHLKHRRICTHRPEEIRGGGLLRYCNLLARDFKPGDIDASDSAETSSGILSLEQHMCSRFFIDFNDIERQQKKLLSYLDNHFHGEDELKFQYLLILRRVVETSTVCLMHHERTMILDLITMLARQSLANNLSNTVPEGLVKRHIIQCAQQSLFANELPCRFNSNSNDAAKEYNQYFRPICTCMNSFCRQIPAETCQYISKSHDTLSHSRSPTPTSRLCKDQVNHRNYSESSLANVYMKDSPTIRHYSWFCWCHFSSNAPFCPLTCSTSKKVQELPRVVAPIYYNPEKMTCFYQPSR